MAKLFYVMGASGAGKDSVIRYARDHLPPGARVAFAHRYITRASDAGGENHVALSEAEFSLRCRYGLFALHWQSHGHCYGIGVEVDRWLSEGISVVVNGSREYFAEAAGLYPDMVPVLVKVNLDVLADRLRIRGRETEDEILMRVRRAAQLGRIIDHPHLVTLSNNQRLQEAGQPFVNMLLESEVDACESLF